ncbi:MAG: PDZ domain-containing protein [Planctomycetota bacterium]|nr:PDZ domain-containing protein [Planctomycetota bacterium]
MRFPLLFLLLVSCSYTVQPADLPPSFYGIDVAETIDSAETAFLGVETLLLQSDDAFSLDVQPGVLIKAVGDGSPAGIAGLRIGDILLSYDSHPTDDPQRLTSLLASERHSRSVQLEIQRGTEVLVADVELAMKITSRLRSKYFIERGLLRVAFSNTEDGMPQIVKLDNLSPLLGAGVVVGDVVQSFQGHDPGSSFELVRRIRSLGPGENVTMAVVKNDGTQQKVICKAWQPERFLTEVGLWPLFYYKRYPGQDKGVFTCGNLVLVDLFSYERDRNEKKYSILGFFGWHTGELILEEE